MSKEHTSSAPAYKVVYGIVKRESAEKGFWTRIGAAFPNDGSLTVRLDFLPASPDVTLHIRDPKADDDDRDGER